jgi:hypothetical protein
MLTEGTKYGLGLHYQDMYYTKMPTIAWISYGGGFATILSTVWSKTSFAITLLRLSSSPWMKWLIWFIIISVNIVLGFSAAIMWIQCWPVAKLWTFDMPGSRWPYYVVQNYQTFASGTWLLQTLPRYLGGVLTSTTVYSGTLDIVLTLLPWKIVWNVAINKKEKIGALIAMSMGVLYAAQSLFHLVIPSYQFLCSSSGIISFLKIISLDDISDSSCESSTLLSLMRIIRG